MGTSNIELTTFSIFSFVGLLVGAVLIRLAVWLMNRFLGPRAIAPKELQSEFDAPSPVADEPVESSDNPYAAPLTETPGFSRESRDIIPTPGFLRAAAAMIVGWGANLPINAGLALLGQYASVAPVFVIYLGSFPVSALIYAAALHWILRTPKFRYAIGIILILYALAFAFVVIAYLLLLVWIMTAGP